MLPARANRFTTPCRQLLILLASFSLSLFIAASANAADFYMSPSGSDSNPGTLAAPWKTLNRSRNTVRAGDTVYLRGGDYFINERQVLNGASGTASAPITYKNYQGETPRIITDAGRSLLTTTSLGASLLSISKPYYIIDGISFAQTEASRRVAMENNTPTADYASASAAAMYLWASNITIRNCSIDNMSGQGIHIAHSNSNVLIENCKITGVGTHSFYIRGKNGTFRYNVIDPRNRGYHLQEGINIQYVSAAGNKIYGNLIRNTHRSGIMFSGRISNNEVFNNIFINPGSGATGGLAVGFWCEDGPIGPGNKFYNNTIIGKTSTLISGSQCRNKDTGYIGRNVEIYNNIFHPSSPARVGLQTSNIRNNIFYNISGSAPPGNTLVNPNLVNPNGNTSADAMLKEGSPAIDEAIPPSPINDYQGGKRPFPVGGKADIGAFEFGAPPGEEKGPLGGGSFPPSGPLLLGPNGEVCPSGYL